MKIRTVILLLLLNVAALGAGFVLLQDHLARKYEKTTPHDALRSRAGQNSRPMVVKTRPAPVLPPAPPTVVYMTNQFRWSQLESTDYRQYIANLRGIGCPEATIRDIILTDVMRLYAARRGQSYQNGRSFKFWETDDKRKLKQSQLEKQEKELAAIDKELPAVLRELLGINYERELNKYFVDTDEDNRRLAFLSEDKRNQLLALRDQIETERDRVLYASQDGQLTPGMLTDLKRIEAQRQEALSKLLTPEEREQYQLCTSETADRLRRDLVGFNPTEAEFREIFQRQKALDEKYAFENLSDESVAAAKAADEAKMEAEVKTSLGDSRAAEYDRAKNPDYRDLTALAERYDLPSSTTQTLLDIRSVAEAERNKLVNNRDLTQEVRFRALQAIERETEQTVRQTLGDQAFAEYSGGGGEWMKKLGPN